MAFEQVPESQLGVTWQATPVPPARVWWRASARYWVCLALLGLSAGSLNAVTGMLGVVLRKEAIPLKRPLQLLDTRKLAPAYELDKVRSDAQEPMTEDMLETLGTHEYLQTYLLDTRKTNDDPTRVALVFITYYTGRPDMVPHEPDACWGAAGYDRVSAETVRVRVPGVGAPNDTIPVRVMQFKAGRRDRFAVGATDSVTVVYFFHANGRYALTRNDVRESLSNPFQRLAYYAKVEVTFLSGGSVRAGKDASVAALGPLLERLMPVLLNDHFRLEKFGSPGQPVAAGAP